MRYISTRGQASQAPQDTDTNTAISFQDALLNGLARDGGLYLPISIPRFTEAEIAAMAGMSYAGVAGRIMARFTDGEIGEGELTELAASAYAGFSDPAIAPLRHVSENLHVLELFHGPTIAFKDYAMQVLSRLFDRALAIEGRRAVILGATSGDTGSAALEAFRDRDAVDVFILFPKGRVSPVQQKQMTSVIAEGVYAVAVDGDFDDCQQLVKSCFNDLKFRDQVHLSAVNSINWARLMPQIVYYFTAALALGAPQQKVAFSVPTGNFGNVFAGWIASQMGLPIERLIVASNQNDILTRFFAGGVMQRGAVIPSTSPSMDIQVSSNFERLLFGLLDGDGQACAALMQQFSDTGHFAVPEAIHARAQKMFSAYRLDDDEVAAEIRALWQEHGMMLDPHSGVGFGAARRALADGVIGKDTPLISLACAHPAKFPAAVEAATGTLPILPPPLADLMDREEIMLSCANQMSAVQSLVLNHMRG